MKCRGIHSTEYILIVISAILILDIQSECIYTKCRAIGKRCPSGYTEEGYENCSCPNKNSRKLICCRDISASNSNATDKIVGGSAAQPSQFPYQISIRYSNSPGPDGHYCGGSIYNENFIITAAHCNYYVSVGGSYHPIGASELETVAGDYRLLNPDPMEQRIKVGKIISHEGYIPGKHHSDIALLKLSKPLSLNRNVDKILLAPDMHTATGTGVISGWGSTKDGYGPYPNTLRYANVTVITDAACRDAYSQNTIADYMICAYTVGGPMVCDDTGFKYLCGIVSFGRGCAEKDSPGVYSEVSHFLPWIEKNAV